MLFFDPHFYVLKDFAHFRISELARHSGEDQFSEQEPNSLHIKPVIINEREILKTNIHVSRLLSTTGIIIARMPLFLIRET